MQNNLKMSDNENTVDTIINVRDEENSIHFMNEEGYCMHFIIILKDKEKQKDLKEKLEKHSASVSFTTEDVGPYSAVLVDDNLFRWDYPKEVFKISYLKECFNEKRIQNINDFLRAGNNIKENFDFMDIVYSRKYSWNQIPERYLKKREQDSDESEEELANINIKPYGANKNTRTPYSKKEKEAIIQYIVSRKLYTYVRGVSMWKELERLNVCPIRSWQSMKEHTLKTLSKEISSFKNLTDKEREKLRRSLN